MNNNLNQIPKRVFTTTEAAEYIGLSESLLRKTRTDGRREGRTNGPQWVKLGVRKVAYYREDLDAWLDAQKAANACGGEG